MSDPWPAREATFSSSGWNTEKKQRKNNFGKKNPPKHEFFRMDTHKKIDGLWKTCISSRKSVASIFRYPKSRFCGRWNPYNGYVGVSLNGGTPKTPQND